MNCRAAFLCFDENGQPEQSFIQQQGEKEQVRRHVENPVDLKHRIEGLRTPYDIGNEFYDWPIYGRNTILGVLRIPVETARLMSEAQTRLLHSMIESTALAMDVSHTSHIFLFHRSFMQFCGGLGFVMMMVTLVKDKQSMNLYNAEGHPDKLVPNLKKTAQTICVMYNGFLAAGTLAYVLAGMAAMWIFTALPSRSSKAAMT